MYEMDDIEEIREYWWTSEDYCVHVIFLDGWEYCSARGKDPLRHN